MTEKKNYGTILSTEITDKGYSKKKIAQHLDIGVDTLNTRLNDGQFTITQVEILKEKRYIDSEA